MRGYLFSSRKVLTVEIECDLSAFPEQRLLTIVLVVAVTECAVCVVT